MKKSEPASGAATSALIDARIAELGDWRGELLSRARWSRRPTGRAREAGGDQSRLGPAVRRPAAVPDTGRAA